MIFLKLNTRRFAAVLAMAFLATGCTVLEEAKRDTETTVAKAEETISKMETGAKRKGAVTRHPGQRLASAEMSIGARKAQLPKIFAERFPYRTAGMTLSEVAEDISQRTGLRVRVQDVLAGSSGASASPAMPQVPGGGGQAGLASTSLVLQHEGTLSALLDTVAEKTQSYYRFENGVVEFFKQDTRTFQVYLPRVSRSLSESINLGSSGGGGGSSGGGGGGSSASSLSVSSTATIDAYDALVRAVQGLVGSGSGPSSTAGAGSGGAAAARPPGGGASGGSADAGGGAVISNKALGMITVTAQPPVLERVASYIDKVNQRFSQNIFISVRVLSLNLNKDASLGLTANGVLANSANKLGLSFTGGGVPSTQAGTPSLLTAKLNDSGANSVDLFLKALNTYGTVTQVTSGQVNAVNGQPSPFQSVNDVGFIASTTSTTVPNVGVQTSQTPGSVRVGFSANFVPLILGDNRIMLDYSITLSSAQIQQLGGANGTTSTANVASQSLANTAYVKDGEALVLLGFESNRTTQDQATGVTSVGQAASTQRQLTVIVMEVYGGRS